MPAEPRTAVLKRDGSLYYYGNYADAVADASSANRDTIVVYADLDEPIVLKDKVDIWIYPGVEVNRSSAGVTITDNNEPVVCNIYGMGIIKNTYDNNAWYECIKISNPNSKVSIECDYIEGIGGTNLASLQAPCIYIANATKFHLVCNRVYNQRNTAIFIGSTSNIISDINLNIQKIETGILEGSTYYGSSALITHANGFLNIDEILCRNLGHCLSHRAGEITARIKKMTTVNNIQGLHAATVHVPSPSQGTGTQKLILYFDEIQSLREIQGTGYSSDDGIQISGGTGIFIGRRVFSNDVYGISIIQPYPLSSILTHAYINCQEIESNNFAGIYISNVTNEVNIIAVMIKGYSFYTPVYGQGTAKFLIRNAYLRNRDTTSNSRCIVLEKTNNNIPNMTLNNVKAVTSNTSSGSIIHQAGFSGISIKNYGLFANKALDSGITLTIGNSGNYFFINSTDLT